MTLTAAQEARILDGARLVPDGDRDAFFKEVADRLRPILSLTDRGVRGVVGDALTIYRRRPS